MARDAPERDGDRGERDDVPPSIAVGLADVAVPDEVGTPTGAQVAADQRRSTAIEAAVRDLAGTLRAMPAIWGSSAFYREAMASAGQRGGQTAFADPGELEAPEG